MHALVTGASGFVGRALVQRLVQDADALPRPLSLLTVVDQHLPDDGLVPPPGLRLRRLQGDIGDPRVWSEALSPAPELVYHLASLPGSLAERQLSPGLQANLLAPIGPFSAWRH